MRIFFSTLVFSVIFSTLNSQTSVQGTVLDSLKTPVAFCNPGLLQAKDSSLVKGTLTDEAGRFVFESVAPGNYLLKINHVGFAEAWLPFTVPDSASQTRLEPVILKQLNITLNEVGVVAIREPIEFRNGNMTLNVEGSPLAAGNTAYDLLSRLPGAMVDNTSITIQGKGGVKLYIDDRPQRLSGAQLINLLKSLSASSIDKIEIINNPSVKYDAQGDAGIIHIRTKKIKLVGFSGNINLSYSQGFYANTIGGFSLNYKGNKFAFFSNINGNQGPRHNTGNFHKRVEYNGRTTQLDQRLISTPEGWNGMIDLGLDWYLNKRNIIGFKVQTAPGYTNNKEKAITLISDTSLGYDQLILEKSQPNYWLMPNYNINSEHILDTLGTKLRFSTDYYGPNYDAYTGNYKNTFVNSLDNTLQPTQEFTSSNTVRLQIWIGKLDFETKLPKGLSLEAGAKSMYQNNTNVYDLKRKDIQAQENITDSSFTNTFRYIEKVNAAYLNLSKEFKTLSLQLGLRAEHTGMQTHYNHTTSGYTRNYFNIFPVLSINYNRSKEHTFSLTYNKRIERPEYSYFNPYRSFVDVLNYFEGNPLIRPAYSNNLNFNYVLKSSIYNSLSYSYYQYPISGYFTQNDSTKETIQHVKNLDYFTILRYSFFIKKDIRKWWVMSFNFGTYYISYSGDINNQAYSFSAVPHYEWLSNTFLLSKGLKIELTGYYWGPYVGIGYTYRSRGGLSLAVKKSFLKDNLNCSVSLNDIFFTETNRSQANFQNQEWQRFESFDSRRLNVSVSYNFGKIKAEKRAVHSDMDQGQTPFKK